MDRRLKLQKTLVDILGSNNVYYQPPSNISLQYPCIIYAKETVNVVHADNVNYKNLTQYQVTVIDRNPESKIPDDILKLPLCSHNTRFVKDNLNQDIFTLYF